MFLKHSNQKHTHSLVIFDWDGTLYNSIPAIVNAVQSVFKHAGSMIPTEQQIKRGIGLTNKKQFEQLINTVGPVDLTFESFIERFYHEHQSSTSSLFSYTLMVLDHLKGAGVACAIATGKERDACLKDLDHYSLLGYFDTIRGAEDGPSKPSPTILESIMDELNVKKERVLMVGDSVLDIQAGQAAGIKTYAVASGSSTFNDLHEQQPTYIAHDLEAETLVRLVES